MKRCKVIALIICSVVVVICTAMIIRINIQFPKAEDKSYTIDNPADIDGVIVKPLSYQVCTIDEYSQISSEYSKVKDEKKDKCRIVVLTISIENTTEEVADYTPSFIFVSEELNAFNGAIPIGSGSRHCTLLPHETKEMKLRAYIGASQLDQNNLDIHIEGSLFSADRNGDYYEKAFKKSIVLCDVFYSAINNDTCCFNI